MIIVQLKGGFGNQLFQYAAGLSLAMHHNVPVKVDVQQLQAPDEAIGTMRNYELQHLCNPPLVATDDEVQGMLQQNLITRYFQKLLPSYKRKVYNEKQLSYDDHFFSTGSNIYLKGYRQSEKYFHGIREQVTRDFQLQPTLVNGVEDLAHQLREINSVSIHIRQGDYANKAVRDYHGILPPSYYQQAIDTIVASVDKPLFFIFSDSVEWVKNNLKFQHEVEFISGNRSKSHYEDFHLMSQCRHNIIANSTFSWWAAWLNDNPGKQVIAPKKWYNKAELDTMNLIPKGWVRL